MRRLRWMSGVVLVLAVAGCGPRTAPVAAGASSDPSPNSTGALIPGLGADPTPVGGPSASPPPPTKKAAPMANPPPAAVLAGQAPTQLFAVGTRQLSLSRGNRPLRTVVWYPATGTAGGAVKSNATPASGRFPLVLFSHGLTASPESYQALTVKFAAAGFVVAAPAYPFTSSGASQFNAADLVNQPADASFVITEVLKLDTTSGDALAGHIDGTRVAAGGHSAGGYTTVGLLSGSTRDTRLKAGIVLSGGSLGQPFSGVATPVLFAHGDADEVVPYSTGRDTYARLTWPKAFLTIVGGNHVSPAFGTGAGTVATAKTMLDFLRWTLDGDAGARSRLPADAAAGSSTKYESTF